MLVLYSLFSLNSKKQWWRTSCSINRLWYMDKYGHNMCIHLVSVDRLLRWSRDVRWILWNSVWKIASIDELTLTLTKFFLASYSIFSQLSNAGLRSKIGSLRARSKLHFSDIIQDGGQIQNGGMNSDHFKRKHYHSTLQKNAFCSTLHNEFKRYSSNNTSRIAKISTFLKTVPPLGDQGVKQFSEKLKL